MDLAQTDFDRLTRALTAHTIAAAREGSSDFDLNPDMQPKGLRRTPASVLVPLVARHGGVNVILTRRTADLKHHPGQVAFPGGKQDPSDGSVEATALREAEEEIGLRARDVTLLGALDPHHTATGFHVSPILGRVSPDFVATPHPGEVAEVFEVPLRFLMDPDMCRVETRLWYGQARRYYVIPYGPYYVWGATARMLVGLQARWASV